MARNRQIFQSDLIFIGPTGNWPVTGQHFDNSAGTLSYGQAYVGGQVDGDNLINQLHRVQRADYGWSTILTDVNQFGELAAIDRVSLEQPTVNLTFSYLLNNFINEKLIGFDINTSTSTSEISALSGILNNSNFDSKNYFIKTMAEGSDAIDNNIRTYNVIGIGNGFLSSYTTQGAVGGFPTVDITVEALNIQCDYFADDDAAGNIIPAIFASDGTTITGWYYRVPSGLTSYSNTSLTANQGISVLRPGDITLNLGLNANDGFFSSSDLKIQSYNLSVNLARENLLKLGSKYAYAKVITFPIKANLTVNAIVGDFQTANLAEMVTGNRDFNPTITITKPGAPSTTICQYKLKGAKLESNDISSSIGPSKQLTMTFGCQIASAQDNTKGMFLSGITT